MTASEFEAVAARADFGRATARKTGRNPRWPYVPVLAFDGTEKTPFPHVEQIRGLAYATRSEAVDAAERHIKRARADLVRKLADPRYRALREQYGLPRELEVS